jgi:hypothetical protein
MSVVARECKACSAAATEAIPAEKRGLIEGIASINSAHEANAVDFAMTDDLNYEYRI